jgi:hypothetical protein
MFVSFLHTYNRWLAVFMYICFSYGKQACEYVAEDNEKNKNDFLETNRI